MSSNTTLPSKYMSICLVGRTLSLSVNPVEEGLIGTLILVLVLFGIFGNFLNLTVFLSPNLRTRLVFVICLERLITLEYPLSVRKQAKFFTPRNVVSIIVVTTFLLTSYNHVSHACREKLFCNGTQNYVVCLDINSERWFRNEPNPNSELMKSLVRYAPQVNAIFVVLIPVILVIIFNVMLILTLRQRQQLFEPSATIRDDSLYGSQAEAEYNATITVAAIVTCFTITQSPSAFVTFLSFYIQKDWFTLRSICTILVVLGKALNFVLFCLTSASFRQRLMEQLNSRKSTRYTSVATH